MVVSKIRRRSGFVPLLMLAALVCAGLAPVEQTRAGNRTAGGRKSLGTITGSVRDSRGNPLAGALVTLLREGAGEVVRQTRSAADGRFVARVAPGTYVLRAAAEGFGAATFSSVRVNGADELVYRFNLEPVGQGRTAPERRPDRDDPKFRLRASHARRSVFQVHENEDSAARAAEEAVAAGAEEVARVDGEDEAQAASGEQVTLGSPNSKGRPTGAVQTFFTSSAGERGGDGLGLNFALASPVNGRLDLIFAGQLGALDRLEATARLRAGSRHKLSATLGGARLNSPLAADDRAAERGDFGQLSVRAVDEWVVRDGVVVVLGLDYSRFVGAGGGADSLSPRLGLRFDADARTRLKAAYAPGGDERRVQSAALFEDAPVLFYEGGGEAIAVVDGNVVTERSRRLEFGVERVIDNNSLVEASAFFDTTNGRGVGLLGAPLASLGGEGGAALLRVANQQGGARGLRVIYTRRIGNSLKASAGYSFGRGQQLNADGAAEPEQLFQNAYFQTAAAQLDAEVADGTRVRTVLKFSPRAAVFAIDPFAGQLAVYDPSLSILVTQELPSFGLPLRAEAVLDARNLLDALTSVEDGETLLSATIANRRTLRGGISVRF